MVTLQMHSFIVHVNSQVTLTRDASQKLRLIYPQADATGQLLIIDLIKVDNKLRRRTFKTFKSLYFT